MIFRKCSSDSRGIILIDILLALTLSTLFIVLTSEIALESRSLFNRTIEKARLLKIYEAHASRFDDLLPYQARTINADSFDSVVGASRWYGNDRIETIIEVRTSSSSPISFNNLVFSKVRAYPYVRIEDAAGTPLCSPYFSPKGIVGLLITPISLPVPPTLPLTDLEVRNSFAYVAADSAIASDPDVLIFDIASSSAPSVLATINTGPGVSALALAGKRIFAAAVSTVAELHVIRIDALTGSSGSLVLEKRFQLPLPYATATPPFGSAIFYDRQKIYLGTEKWDGAEFSIIDVSNPADPRFIGGFETSSKVNDIFVREIQGRTLAFVAASDENQLRIIDVTDPANPFLAQSFSPSGWQRQEGKAVNFFEDALSFARTPGGFNLTQDHELFVWSTTSLTTLSTPSSVDNAGGIYGIVTDRNSIFVATRNGASEFEVRDRNLGTSSIQSFSLPSVPQVMTCDNRSLYVLGKNAPAIYQINF